MPVRAGLVDVKAFFKGQTQHKHLRPREAPNKLNHTDELGQGEEQWSMTREEDSEVDRLGW